MPVTEERRAPTVTLTAREYAIGKGLFVSSLLLVGVVLLVAVILFNRMGDVLDKSDAVIAVQKEQLDASADARARLLAITEAINSCVQPTGECAQRNAAGTIDALVAQNLCSRLPSTASAAEIHTCIAEAIQAAQP